MSCPGTRSSPITVVKSSADIPKAPKLGGGNSGLGGSPERVRELVLKRAAVSGHGMRGKVKREKASRGASRHWDLDEAYDRCIELAAKDLTSVITSQPLHSPSNSALSFLIKTILSLLAKQEELKAVSALAVWCRRTDELVDGSNGSGDLEILEQWEQRLMDVLEGHPHDPCDVALFDTITNYQVNIQLLKDLIEGMRLDMKKTRYENFNELYLYSYYATGAPLLMCIEVIGFSPQSKASWESVHDSILSYAVALQLTDILRDITQDAKMGRIYLPQDELLVAGISDEDILSGRMSYEWYNFMEAQVGRARTYSKKGEVFIRELKPEARWFFWWLLLMYNELLENIEANNYDFKREASIGVTKQLETLILAQRKTLAQQLFNLV